MTTEKLIETTNGTVQHSDEPFRAEVFRLLSCAFTSPREMSGETVAEFELMIPELPDPIRNSGKRVVECWLKALEDPDAFILAYSKLFLGPFEILSPPYASIYLEPDQKLMGEISGMVAREYSDAGLAPGTGPNEVPDHVALEWEFMYFLTYKFSTTEDEDWLVRRDRFFTKHMRTWLPQFSEQIISAGVHDFYISLAKFQLDLVNSWS